MYKLFNSFDELFAHIHEDKHWTGANAAHHDRYPIRFVLFDNFSDFNEFIINRPDGIFKHSIEQMLDKDYLDSFLSYTELSKEIRLFTKKLPVNDFIIYPFSEMARFYDNEENTEFDALIKTIRGEQAPDEVQKEHVRIYIPIVGMQGKMGKFMNDNTTFVWEYRSGTDKGTYKLVVTNGSTYGVSGLTDKYTVVSNLCEWLKIWEQGENVKPIIICSSENIYENYKYAQPDNAFTYLKCSNSYEFLTKGLQIDFGVTEEPCEEEMPYWDQFASIIDLRTFNFDEFIKERFDTFSIQDGIDFIKSWFECESDFDRWLLTIYFRKVSDTNSYVLRAVSKCAKLSKSELFSNLATLIFDNIQIDKQIEERLKVLNLGAEQGVRITDLAKNKVKARLKTIASSPEEGGYYQACKLLTPLTDVEFELAIEWVASGKISKHDIKGIFPSLYNYLLPLSLSSLGTSNQWVNEYIDAYRQSKISDTINEDIYGIIKSKNHDSSSFQGWNEDFKTVRTLLYNRTDIDVFYWIDGLGIDWIPFIREIISQYDKEKIYLNEIHIAVSKLPTTTDVNKPILQSLMGDGHQLLKIGDLDQYAHSSKSYPQYIIDEMRLVEEAVCKVLDEYNGKKIAFISDHGITYLAQKEVGLKLGGIIPEHEGRLAIATSSISTDNQYMILEDGKTICSLTHKSLSDKVNKGHGAHGGCTPEEVLVPIIIVSSEKNNSNFSVYIKKDEIIGSNPTLKFTIKGLSSIDVPTLKYNGVDYQITHLTGNDYQSERLNVVDTATKATIYINGADIKSFNLKISTGVEENDLF